MRWWRYSSKAEALVQQVVERDHWTEKDWTNYREDRLEGILDRAVKQVPYYQDLWSERKREGDRSSWHYLENWPILTKELVRGNPKLFLVDDCDPRKMYLDHTGGTTGTPLSIFESRDTVQRWYAMYEARVRRWHQVSYMDRWAIFGGQMVVPLDQQEPPFWIENIGLHQLYLSTFHISRQNTQAYVRKINQFKPTHIVVYPSSATEFALEIVAQDLKIWSPRVVISNAEPLSNTQRKILTDAFHCPVINTYGMGEMVYGAGECKNQKMHSWPDSGFLEVLDDNYAQVSLGGAGSFVMTGLLNWDMPLIRYMVGDRGTSESPSQCTCGRTLPVLDCIEGRNSDMLVTSDGRKIFWLNPIFYDLNISQAQIIQEEIDRIRVKVVPAKGFCSEDIDSIITRLHDRVGKMAVVLVDQVDSISREKNGKVRPVISLIK